MRDQLLTRWRSRRPRLGDERLTEHGSAARFTPTVLVVDAYPDIRYVVRDVLEAEALAVVEAASCHDALTGPLIPDLVLAVVNLVLPDGDGVCLVRELRQRSDVPLPVVLLTTDPQVQAEALGLTHGQVLQQPFDIDDLTHAVWTAVCGVARSDPPPSALPSATDPEDLSGWVLS